MVEKTFVDKLKEKTLVPISKDIWYSGAKPLAVITSERYEFATNFINSSNHLLTIKGLEIFKSDNFIFSWNPDDKFIHHIFNNLGDNKFRPLAGRTTSKILINGISIELILFGMSLVDSGKKIPQSIIEDKKFIITSNGNEINTRSVKTLKTLVIVSLR